MLNEKIASAQSDIQRNQYLEARESIDPARSQLLSRYQRALQQAFDDFASGYDPEPEAAPDRAGLALIDKSQYEDDVAVRTMASKAGAVNAEELWKLNRRFAVIRGGKKCPDELNPCGPQQLCDAMRETYRKLQLDPVIKLMLYKLYDQQLLARTGSLYKELNQELAEKGVLKNLNFSMSGARAQRAAGGGAQSAVAVPEGPATSGEDTAAQGENTPASGPAQGSGAYGAANDPMHPATGFQPEAPNPGASLVPMISPEVERRQARVMEAIKAVQQKRRKTDVPRTSTMGGASYGSIVANGVAGQADTFTERDLAVALGVLQTAMQLPMSRQAEARKVSDTENKLMGELGAMGREQARQKVTAVDADTIDLVGMLFDYMLDDPQLPDGLKSLLSHLHTPYMKVALLDKEFFASSRHPARILLDLMAAAGARWLQDGDDDEKVYQRIRLVVERIIKEFDDDLAFFDELLKDFTRFVKLLEKRADLASQRSVEAEKGLDQLSQAKDLADGEIARRIVGAKLPGPVRELLEQHWSDYLAFNYLRHGGDSESWRSGLEVVERIVASTRAQNNGGPPEQLKAEHAAVNELVGSGFSSLGLDRDKGQLLLKALREAQRQVQKGEAPKLAGEKYPRASAEAGSAIARQLKQQRSRPAKPVAMDESRLSKQEKVLADKLSSVSFGTWFEFKQGVNSPSRRLKLSWYSSISGNYMFVNHSGIKTAVKTLPELLRGMNSGCVVMLERESRNFFERAVSSVLGRLSKA